MEKDAAEAGFRSGRETDGARASSADARGGVRGVAIRARARTREGARHVQASLAALAQEHADHALVLGVILFSAKERGDVRWIWWTSGQGFSRDTQSMPIDVARRGAGASRRSRAGHAPLPRGGSGPPRTAARAGGPPPPRTATCPPSRASPFPPSRSARLDDRKTRSVTRALRSVASLPFPEKSRH